MSDIPKWLPRHEQEEIRRGNSTFIPVALRTRIRHVPSIPCDCGSRTKRIYRGQFVSSDRPQKGIIVGGRTVEYICEDKNCGLTFGSHLESLELCRRARKIFIQNGDQETADAMTEVIRVGREMRRKQRVHR